MMQRHNTSAFVTFYLQLRELKLKNCKDIDDFLHRQRMILRDREATGVTLVPNLEIVINLYDQLPREFERLKVRWRVTDFKGLIAVQAQREVDDEMRLHRCVYSQPGDRSQSQRKRPRHREE